MKVEIVMQITYTRVFPYSKVNCLTRSEEDTSKADNCEEVISEEDISKEDISEEDISEEDVYEGISEDISEDISEEEIFRRACDQ